MPNIDNNEILDLETLMNFFLTKTAHTLHTTFGPQFTALTIKILSYVYQLSHTVGSLFYRTFGAVIDEFSINGNLWVFRGCNTQPLPYKVFNHYPADARWFYNKNVNTLYEALSPDAQISSYVQLNTVKLPWIMSALSHHTLNESGVSKVLSEWYLDDWVSTFLMVTNYHVISPKVIISCWSIQSEVWFSDSDCIRLEIIDRNGERCVIDNINAPLSEADEISWRKILGLESLPVNDDSSEFETDEEEDDEYGNFYENSSQEVS